MHIYPFSRIIFVSSQIGVKYGGEDIPGSPFEMTSNADTSDVIGDGSRKSSGKVNKKYLYCLVVSHWPGYESEDVITRSAIISKLLCVSFTAGKCLRPGLERSKMSYRHKSLDCVSGL